ncbi:bifunctional DNA-formamidopyrimidine glycosylase/DNA-(apurinic or apyrimidinic site) lyase [Cutibacterium sp.]|uniref:bifunctional DNA-formamidopyrimidine glycosylase/DNA-(apurinic or apyrimidinic site) lyase n=1 Tax=Cutibacterium sp. TaxID=1912221 RepID=UPI0026DD5280|nr:bifunctional DNA-formamidopyrimidine glycosylase/DNA-(apurinic or apyrimidinic site) lyase [Cutibacterium sp.]MDO4413277.1 bifunctional DNA-formamidopyrimidine glycosylase/DNA-(apurinic or apyrimidinic site) lyase [Cutibacterium sp.]
MPELPEVETVRAGLERLIIPSTVEGVDVVDVRGLRPTGGPEEAKLFETTLTGRQLTAIERRGKYLWFVLDDGMAMLAHLGMSGQFRVVGRQISHHRHTRVVIRLGDGRDLRFLDQRTFGGLAVVPLIDGVPEPVSHIAPDPFESCFDIDEVARRLRARRSTIKRSLLDQTLVSGIGNIYADETLWRVRRHPETPCSRLSQRKAVELLETAREVMAESIAQGGTSFDSLYVNVNGESGYFDRTLDVYGRQGKACRRCGSFIVRESFANRSSHRCPKCQRLRG